MAQVGLWSALGLINFSLTSHENGIPLCPTCHREFGLSLDPRVVLANARPVPGLEPKHLQLGTTSKDKKSGLAGSHGEGFKVAAMVMSRAGYKVRIEASNYNWSFHFGGQSRTQFKCTLNPSKKNQASAST